MKNTGIYSFWGASFYIDKDNGSMFVKKAGDNEFHEILKEKMDEILEYYKGDNLLYQPVTVQVYRAFKNGQLSKFKELLVS